MQFQELLDMVRQGYTEAEPMRFLGHHVLVRPHPVNHRVVSATVVPRDRSQRLREIVKDLLRGSWTEPTLAEKLRQLNPLLRGWGNFYRHAWGAKRVFGSLDSYVWWTIFRWLRKRHRRVARQRLFARYGRRQPSNWGDGKRSLFMVARLCVEQFRLGWLRPPPFAQTYGEPGA